MPSTLIDHLTLREHQALYDQLRGGRSQVLLRRGAGTRCCDVNGRTPMDIAVMKGRVADEELFLLLAAPK